MSYRRVVRSVGTGVLSVAAVVSLQVGFSSEVWAATPTVTTNANWDGRTLPANWDGRTLPANWDGRTLDANWDG